MESIPLDGFVEVFLRLMNWGALGVGFLFTFLLGVLWYQDFLFGKIWQKHAITDNSVLSRPPLLGFLFAFLTAAFMSFIMTLGASGLEMLYIIAVGPNFFTDPSGYNLPGYLRLIILLAAAFGIFLLLFFVLGMMYLFARKKMPLVLIDSGYLFVSLMGLAVLNGLWSIPFTLERFAR